MRDTGPHGGLWPVLLLFLLQKIYAQVAQFGQSNKVQNHLYNSELKPSYFIQYPNRE